jgi:transposase
LLAVAAVQNGAPVGQTAKQFGVNRGTVSMWLKKRREGGEAALRKKRQGRPPGKKISAGQARVVIRAIVDHTPDQLKLPFALWTREAVRDLIAKRFGLRVSVMTAGRWLKSWGMTPQKPVRKAFEQDPEAVRRWLEEEYPIIRKWAKQEGAEIHWGDEMGMRSDHQTGTSYGLKGQTPVIPGTGQRFGCSMISTITNRGTLRFMVFKGSFQAPVMIRFLKRLLQSVRGKIYLIIDSHPVHRSRRVKKWVADKPRRIKVFYLPAYSPDLNPDEYLNNDVKGNAVGRRRAMTQGELMADVRGYCRSTQKRPEIVKKFFEAPQVRYALN